MRRSRVRRTTAADSGAMPHDQLRVTVECYAGHRGEQTPRAVTLGERRVEVAEVLDAWLAPDHRYFKLKGADGHTYVVRHDVTADSWELAMYQHRDDTRLSTDNE